MPRIRTIKPEFPQSESMGRVSRDARLLFVLLWTLSDDFGRLRGNSRMLASLLFPYDDDANSHICGWLSELDREGCIACYNVDGDSYVEILNWSKHQKVDKPTKSKIPAFSESSRIIANHRESSCGDQGPRTEGSRTEGPKGEAIASPVLAVGVKPTRRRRTQEEIKLGYSDDVRTVVNHAAKVWPTEDPDGRPISKDMALLCANVELVLKDQRNPKASELIQAIDSYVAKTKIRYAAPQFFFGRQGRDGNPPHWESEWKLIKHMEQRRAIAGPPVALGSSEHHAPIHQDTQTQPEPILVGIEP